MKLREYQAKAIFARYGIRVPRGARQLGGPTVLKPQLGVKGRGKVGGIGFAATAEQAGREAERLLGSAVKGERVERLLVEQRVDIEQELYLAIAVDYAARRPVLMASAAGGVDIEQAASERPEALLRLGCSLLEPPTEQELARVEQELGSGTAAVAAALYRIFVDYRAEMVEINPLVRTTAGLVAVDAVLNVDDAAVKGQPELQGLARELPAVDPLVEEARQHRWTFIDLGGEVAILSSGAGLTMTIVDLLHRRGIQPANFLDTAQFDDEGIYQAFELLRRARPARVWLVNVFAGLNRCDRLAEGIRRYLGEHPIAEAVVVRMVGNFEDEGHAILREAGIEPVRELEQAIEACARHLGEGEGR